MLRAFSAMFYGFLLHGGSQQQTYAHADSQAQEPGGDGAQHVAVVFAANHVGSPADAIRSSFISILRFGPQSSTVPAIRPRMESSR